LALCQNKFDILVHYIYFVLDAQRSAGEQLAGWSFCILNKINKVNENGKHVRFCGALTILNAVRQFKG